MKHAAAALCFAGVVVGVGACATTRQPPRAVFTVDEDRVGPVGKRCGKPIPVIHGSAPADSVESVRYVMTSSEPVPLAEIEAALQSNAARVCADGLAILQAIVEDGDGKVSSVNAVAWIELTPEEAAAQKKKDDDGTIGVEVESD